MDVTEMATKVREKLPLLRETKRFARKYPVFKGKRLQVLQK